MNSGARKAAHHSQPPTLVVLLPAVSFHLVLVYGALAKACRGFESLRFHQQHLVGGAEWEVPWGKSLHHTNQQLYHSGRGPVQHLSDPCTPISLSCALQQLGISMCSCCYYLRSAEVKHLSVSGALHMGDLDARIAVVCDDLADHSSV